MSDALPRVLQRAEIPGAVFTGDEFLRWPDPLRAHLLESGLLRSAVNAASVACDACGQDHIEEVQYIVSPAGSAARAYIPCPENLRIHVDPQRLLQWDVDLAALARAVATALSSSGAVTELVQGRLWRLGRSAFGSRTRDVFLARGASWSDGTDALSEVPRSPALPPLVLVTGTVPKHSPPVDEPMHIVPLTDVARLNGARLTVDRDAITTTLSAGSVGAAETVNASPLDDDGWYASSRIANAYDISADALRKRLQRFRHGNMDGWKDNDDRRRNEPKHLYQLKAVMPVVNALRASARRPTNVQRKKPRRRA